MADLTTARSQAQINAPALAMLSPGTAVGHANPELASWAGTVQANRSRNWARPGTGDVWVVWADTGKGGWYSASALTIAGIDPDCHRPAHYVLPGNDWDRSPGWHHDRGHDRDTCWAAKAAVAARQSGKPAMHTLTRGQAMAWLASLPGHDELVAQNLLRETRHAPYIFADDGLLFIAATSDNRFVFAITGAPLDADGAAFARLLGQAREAGASRLDTRTPPPGWC